MLDRLKKFYKIEELPSNPAWFLYTARTPARSFRFYVRSRDALLYYMTIAAEGALFPDESSVAAVLSIAERMPLSLGLVSIEGRQRIPGTAFDAVCALRNPAHEAKSAAGDLAFGNWARFSKACSRAPITKRSRL